MVVMMKKSFRVILQITRLPPFPLRRQGEGNQGKLAREKPPNPFNSFLQIIERRCVGNAQVSFRRVHAKVAPWRQGDAGLMQ
jgi:hypothetical protein